MTTAHLHTDRFKKHTSPLWIDVFVIYRIQDCYFLSRESCTLMNPECGMFDPDALVQISTQFVGISCEKILCIERDYGESNTNRHCIRWVVVISVKTTSLTFAIQYTSTTTANILLGKYIWKLLYSVEIKQIPVYLEIDFDG